MNNFISNILSTLIGVISGGFITWVVTKKSLKKDFEFRQILNEKKQVDELKQALIIIKYEIQHNIIQAKAALNLMKDENIKYINYKKSNSHNNFIMNNWEKLNHILVRCDSKKLISEVTTFYINISFDIHNQAALKKRCKRFIHDGHNCIKLIEEKLENL